MDLSRIQYVVIVYMENRSFDHVLGYLNLPGNHPKWDQINGIFEAMKYYSGFTYPPHPLTTPNIDPDPPHERENVALQINSVLKKMQDSQTAMYAQFRMLGPTRSWSLADPRTYGSRTSLPRTLPCATAGTRACPRALCRIG